MKIFFLVFLTATALSCKGQPVNYGNVPDFELTDAGGRKVSAADLRGKPWLAAFIFTRCGGQCPMMTAQMKGLSQSLPGVRLVSFSVDPADTPSILKRYANDQEADWLFLTGKKDQVRRLSMEGFKLAVADGGGKLEPLIHSNKLVLVDAGGAIRGYFDGSDDESLRALIRQAREL